MFLHIDNQGAIKKDRTDASGTRTNHINNKYHPVQGLVVKKKICLEFWPSVQMIAGMLTKLIGTQQFSKFQNSIGVKALID